MPLIFVISAPSGCGKTSLIKEFLREDASLVRPASFTTRPRRREERGGVDYNFVSEEEFKRRLKRGDFLEWSKPFGHYYATSRKAVEESLRRGRDVVLNLDVNGALFFKKNFKDAVLIYVSPPSLKALKKRLACRSTDDSAEISKRLSFAKQDISNLKKYDYSVVNDDFRDALQRLKAIIAAERLRVR